MVPAANKPVCQPLSVAGTGLLAAHRNHGLLSGWRRSLHEPPVLYCGAHFITSFIAHHLISDPPYPLSFFTTALHRGHPLLACTIAMPARPLCATARITALPLPLLAAASPVGCLQFTRSWTRGRWRCLLPTSMAALALTCPRKRCAAARCCLPACAAGAARLPAHLLATCRLTNAFECLLQCLAPGGPVMAP